MVENVAIPRHAIGNHDKGSAFFDESTGEQGVLAKCAGSVTVAIGLRNSLQVEEVGAAH